MEREFDIFDAIDRAGLPNRGTLKAWMTTNEAAFDERLLTRKPDWAALAEVFVTAGLLDGRGKPPTAEATRKTWYRVKRSTAKTTTPSTPTQPPVVAHPAATRQAIHPARQVGEPAGDMGHPDQDETDPETPPKFTFRPTKLR